MSKHILITGCSTGFGSLAARHLARRGHHVHATMRGVDGKNASAAEALRAFARDEDLRLDVVELDVTSDASVDAALAAMPTPDVVVNNAGLGYGGPVESFTSRDVLEQLDVNVVGCLRVARAALPGMRARGSGLIVQVSSIAARAVFPGFGVYHASKWGLEGLSEALRYELAPLGIDVVLVEPGPFATHFLGNLAGGGDPERAAAYPHVAAFGEAFTGQLRELFDDPTQPTDPQLVVDAFEHLIDLPDGERPLRTVVGLDFGIGRVNEVTEPVRREILAGLDLAGVDGPRPR